MALDSNTDPTDIGDNGILLRLFMSGMNDRLNEVKQGVESIQVDIKSLRDRMLILEQQNHLARVTELEQRVKQFEFKDRERQGVNKLFNNLPTYLGWAVAAIGFAYGYWTSLGK